MRCQMTSTVIFMALFAATTHARIVFYDDFSDGDHLDGMPVTWGFTGPDSDDEEMVVDGNFVLASGGMNGGYNYAGVPDVVLTDTSIRIQGTGGLHDLLAASVRNTVAGDGSILGYWARVAADGELAVGGYGDRFDVVETDLRPEQEDVVLQFDAIGDQISFWAWRAGESMPDAPLITASDDRATAGFIGISSWNWPWSNEPVEATFRHVLVADIHIPPPLAGDYNIDGTVDAADYTVWRDRLGQNVALPNETVTPSHVTPEDYDEWVAHFGNSSTNAAQFDASVPEPATAALLLVGIAFWLARQRKR